jgi:hypothetical protein
VIGDDGSDDGTIDILREYASRSPVEVRLDIASRRRGSTFNFEHTLGRCTGDVIVLSDQDDVWTREKLHIVAEAFQDHKLALFFSDAMLVDSRLDPLDVTAWQSVNFRSTDQLEFRRGAAFETLTQRNVVTGATMAVSAAALQAALPFPDVLRQPRVPHQHDGWLATIASALGDCAPDPRQLVLYRQHAAQQIGLGHSARTLDRWRRIADERFHNRRYLAEVHASWLGALADRLTTVQVPMLSRRLATLRLAEDHFRRRAQLPRSLPGRGASITREVLRGGYHRHGGGVGASLLDLFSSS